MREAGRGNSHAHDVEVVSKDDKSREDAETLSSSDGRGEAGEERGASRGRSDEHGEPRLPVDPAHPGRHVLVDMSALDL
eukprot:231825-Hanusia_phi.AAC.1